MSENIYANELEVLNTILKYGKPISIEVMYSMIQDTIYAEKIFISRNNPEILSYLMHNPTRNTIDLSERTVKECMRNLLHTCISILPMMELHEKHGIRYRNYVKREAVKESTNEFATMDCREVYMDNNSTTRIRSEVQDVLIEYTKGSYGYGNPSTLTEQGTHAANMIQASRLKIADLLQAESGEIYFTSSGTEANNLAIKGIAFEHIQQKGHIITTMVEHPSVLEPMRYLATLGFVITYLQPDDVGCITVDSLKKALRNDTILVSIMAANNEIGTLYPIREIGLLCKERNIPFMVDGIQAFGKFPIHVKDMNITMLTFSAHKLYGPKGIGGIYIKHNTKLTPLLHGGGQEKGVRSSTENVGYIIALGVAAELAGKEMKEEQERINALRKMLLDGLKMIDSDLIIYGSDEFRLPGLLSVGFPRVSASFLIRELDHIGISVSSGSACSSKKTISHVMEAIGAHTKDMAVIRFGLGRFSDEDDVIYLLRYLGDLLRIGRALYNPTAEHI